MGCANSKVMTHPIQSLRIETSWDGTPVQPQHWITLHLLMSDDELEIRVSAPFYGDPAPPAGPAGPTAELWEHEVVELFICGKDGRYTEIELSPSGHHLVLQLAGVRQPVASGLPIAFEAKIAGDAWTGRARVPIALLPCGPYTFNATAIHGSGDARTYLSWVPLDGSAPDFHQPHCFRDWS